MPKGEDTANHPGRQVHRGRFVRTQMRADPGFNTTQPLFGPGSNEPIERQEARRATEEASRPPVKTEPRERRQAREATIAASGGRSPY